jgi:hypothetical protein
MRVTGVALRPPLAWRFGVTATISQGGSVPA